MRRGTKNDFVCLEFVGPTSYREVGVLASFEKPCRTHISMLNTQRECYREEWRTWRAPVRDKQA